MTPHGATRVLCNMLRHLSMGGGGDKKNKIQPTQDNAVVWVFMLANVMAADPTVDGSLEAGVK